MMGRPALRMAFADAGTLACELEQNLRHGRAFVQGAGGVEVLSDCDVVLVHPESGAELCLAAQAVMVSEQGALVGVGIELRPFGAEQQQLLDRFAAGEPMASADRDTDAEAVTQNVGVTLPEPGAEAADTATDADYEAVTEDLDLDAVGNRAGDDGEGEARDDGDDAHDGDGELGDDGDDTHDADGEGEAGDDGDDAHDGEEGEDGGGRTAEVQRQKAPHERLRGLTPVEQHKRARHGELNERLILERLYGKGVWEPLLHNPRLTPPEVARIARKGTVPRPLLEFILDNNAWIQVATVRRALLGNPRVSGEGINKLLRITPKHELKTIAKTTAYSSMVRDAARKMLER